MIALYLCCSGHAWAEIEIRCSKILLGPQSFKLDYKTKMMTGLNGRQMALGALPGPERIEVATTSFSVVADPRKINEYNHSIQQRKRMQNPSSGGQKGIGPSEQWMYYMNSRLSNTLKELLATYPSEFSQNQTATLYRIAELAKNPIALLMVDDPSQFDLANEHQRIARTTGQHGDPIYVNASLLNSQFVKILNAREAREAGVYVDSKTTPPFDELRTAPFHVDIGRNIREFEDFYSRQAEKSKLATLLGILVHEYAHYLGLKDDANHSIDQLTAQLQKVFLGTVDEVTLAKKNHPWVKFMYLSNQAQRRNGRLILLEITGMYDLTDQVIAQIKQQLKLDMQSYAIANLTWESHQTVDLFHATTPDVLNFDVLIQQKSGEELVVPMRIVNYFGASAGSGLIPDEFAAPWRYYPVQLKIQPSHLSSEIEVNISRVRKSSDVVVPRTFKRILHSKKSYQAGEKWQVTLEVDLDSYNLPQKADLNFTSHSLVNSGFIPRTLVKFENIRIEAIGAKKAFIHAEFQIPPDFHSAEYFVNQLQLTYANRIVEYLPEIIEAIKITAGSKMVTLDWIGITYFMFETPNRTDIKPRGLFKVDEFQKQPFAAAMPILFELDHFSDLRKLSLHGHIEYKKPGGNDRIVGFHAEAHGANKSPFIDRIEVQKRGSKTQIVLMLNLAKFINGNAVEAIYLDSVYMQDTNLKEIFQPSPLGFAIDLRQGN